MSCFLFAWIVGLGFASFVGKMVWVWVGSGVVLGWICLAFGQDRRYHWCCLGMVLGIIFGVWKLPSHAQNLSWNLWVSAKRWPIVREQARDPPVWVSHGKQWVRSRIYRALPDDAAALLAGMLYGEPGLSANDKQSLRNVGLLHLIAISGTNVTFILAGAIQLLLFFGGYRQMAIGIAAFLLGIFFVFVGPSASILRAALMGWMWIFAPIFGRPMRPRRWLLLSAVLQLLWQPTRLLFDAGFALSFLAMLGLLLSGIWRQVIETPERSTTKFLKEFLLMNVAVAMTTMPYLAWAFGRVSWLGLVANFFAEPVVGLIMVFGFLLLIWPSAPWILWPVHGCLAWILWISRFIDRWCPWGVTELSISFTEMWVIYLMLFCLQRTVIHIFSQKHDKKLFR